MNALLNIIVDVQDEAERRGELQKNVSAKLPV